MDKAYAVWEYTRQVLQAEGLFNAVAMVDCNEVEGAYVVEINVNHKLKYMFTTVLKAKVADIVKTVYDMLKVEILFVERPLSCSCGCVQFNMD